MNKITFYIKYIFRKPHGHLFHWNLYIPLLGMVLGTVIVILTLSIMQGMEYEVFSKLRSINHESKIVSNDTKFFGREYFRKGIEKKSIISHLSDFRVVNIISLDKFSDFIEKHINPYMLRESGKINEKTIIIGSSLASKLSVDIGDTVLLTSPLDVQLITGIPPQIQMVIDGIYNMQLLNYDDQFVFIPYNAGQALFNDKYLTYYSDLNSLALSKLNLPDNTYVYSWHYGHEDFIAAMKLEKIAFTLFGVIIIIIAAFTSLSMMCLSIMNRISEIGIMRTIGFRGWELAKIFLLQCTFTGIIGSAVGVIIALGLINLDNKINLIQMIFMDSLLFKFPLIINPSQISLISLSGIIIMLISGIYPAWKSGQIDILQAINYKK